MAKPLISIIIVNYNTGSYLTKAIKSIRNFPGAEVIVVDNSPPHQNLGFSRAVNQGIKDSQAKFICLLNPDAQLQSGALAQMLHTLHSYNDQAILAPRLINPDMTPQPSCYHPQTIWNAIKEFWFNKQGSYAKFLPAQSGQIHAAVAACWLIPRTLWNQLGGFNEQFFLYFEDLEFCDRANRAGIPVIYDACAKVIHQHGTSASANPNTNKLFLSSARTYHGIVKKTLIDVIIRIRDLFIPPISAKKITGILILYAFLVLAITSLGYFLLPSRYTPSSLIPPLFRSNFLLWSWANFDGAHYLNIAANGYQTLLGQSEYAFFPLFPLLINLLSRTGIDLYLSAHLIVLASLWGFVYFLLKWATPYLKNPLNILWLVLLSPGTIFLLSIYTEPLFLIFTILTFYFADQKYWGGAVITTALATATRVNGIFLVVFLFIKLLKSQKDLLTSSIYGLVSSTGLFAYMFYLWQKTGDPLAWYHAQSGWGKSTATLPWATLINYTQALTTKFVSDLTHLVVIIEVVVTFILIYLLVKFWRKSRLDLAYKFYVSGSLALPLATGSLGSLPRFSLTLFPLFLMIPILSPKLRILYYVLSVLTAIIGIILFTRGYWYA